MGTVTRLDSPAHRRGTVYTLLWDGRQWWDGQKITVRTEDVHEFLEQHRLRFVSKFKLFGDEFELEVGSDAEGEEDGGQDTEVGY